MKSPETARALEALKSKRDNVPFKEKALFEYRLGQKLDDVTLSPDYSRIQTEKERKKIGTK